MRKWFLRLAPFALLLALLGIRAPDPAVFEATRLSTFDIWQRAAPRAIGREELAVVVVDIDDETLQRHGYWPWPRSTMARLADRLRIGGARTVAFTMVFAEPDPTSPGQVLPLWPSTPETEALRDVIGTLPDPDKTLATALAGLRAVGGFVLTGPNTARAPALMARIDIAGGDPPAAVPAYRGVVPNLRLIEAATAGNGALTLSADPGTTLRSVPVVLRLHNQLYPSLFAEILRLGEDSDRFEVRGRDPGEPLPGGARVGSVTTGTLTIPTDPAGNMRLYHAHPVGHRVVPAWRLLGEDVADDLVRDKVVVIGVSATGFGRFFRTTFGERVTEAEIIAGAVEQALDRAFISRPPAALTIELGFLLLFGLAGLLLLPRLGPVWGVGLSATVVAMALLGSGLAFYLGRWEIDGVFPAGGFLAVAAAGAVARAYSDRDRRSRLVHVFGRQLSPAALDRVIRRGDRLTLAPETRDVTVLFSHIRGFDHAMAMLEPDALARFLNDYLTAMTGIVQERGGAVDKYLGDRVMAYWNVPLDDPAHAENACRAALAMVRRVRRLSDRRDLPPHAPMRSLVPIEIGIGISTGPGAVGDFGSAQRIDYTVLGSDVALAARLRRRCSYYGVDILLASTTRARVLGLASLEVDLIRTPDRVEPAPIFALLGDEVLAARPGFKVLAESHRAMLAAYRNRQWSAALDGVADCRGEAQPRLSGLYDLYAARIRAFQRQPPPEDWDGVFIDDDAGT